MAFTTNQSAVAELYIAALGRSPEKAGLDYWVGRLESTGEDALTIEEIQVKFFDTATSTEVAERFPATQTDAEYVEAIYVNVFGRASDAEGKAFWEAKIASGSTKAEVMAEMLVAAKASTNDAAALAADLAAAETAYDAEAAAESAATNATATVQLTSGVDTFTGTINNDTFSANTSLVTDPATGNQYIVDTINDLDTISAGEGSDTLNIVTAVTTTNAAPIMTSVENVNVQFKAASTIDLANATGVETVTIQDSTAAGLGKVDNVGTAALAVMNQKAKATFDNSTATELSLSLTNVGTVSATAPVSTIVDLGNAAAAAATKMSIAIDNSNVEIASTTAQTAVTDVAIAATGENVLELTDSDTTATSIAITGTGSVDLSATVFTKTKTLTVADGGVNFTGGILETATTGAGDDTLTVVGATVKSISTGAGDDKVNTVTTALGATSKVDLGAGNDTLSLSTAFAAGATLTGGDGEDTLATTVTDYGTISTYSAANLAKVTSFETLSITNLLAAGNNINVAKIDGITSAQVIGVNTTEAATISGLGANSTVTVKGDMDTNDGDLTISLASDATATDVINVTFDQEITQVNNGATATNIAKTMNELTLTGIETANITSTGTLSTAVTAGNAADTVTNGISIVDADLVTLNISGDQAVDYTADAGSIVLASVDASANTAGATIDLSAGTVAATITGSATASNNLKGTDKADTITGGSEADTIVGGAKGDALTGNGGNDKFVLTAGDSSIGTGSFDTITDFVANTFGNGTANAADKTGATGVAAADLTGDVLEIDNLISGGTKDILVDNFTNAADATTYLANNASSNGVVAAYDATNNNVYIDNTNDGVADFFINLVGVTELDTTAFVIV